VRRIIVDDELLVVNPKEDFGVLRLL